MENKNIIDDTTKIEGILDRLAAEYPEAGCALHFDSRFHLICAVMLSAQTTDVSVNKVTPALFDRYPDAASMAAAEQSDVEEIIRAIGLYRNKAKNLIAMSRELVERFGGEVPGDFDELTSLPGVGRKTANVVLAEGFGAQRIAVDTHVFRVANRIGLVCEKDPEHTEKALTEVLPHDRLTETHHLLIFHGRNCCRARKPDCSSCCISGDCLAFGRGDV
jgi:endonuclease-3